jgi:hypothetical protein
MRTMMAAVTTTAIYVSRHGPGTATSAPEGSRAPPPPEQLDTENFGGDGGHGAPAHQKVHLRGLRLLRLAPCQRLFPRLLLPGGSSRSGREIGRPGCRNPRCRSGRSRGFEPLAGDEFCVSVAVTFRSPSTSFSPCSLTARPAARGAPGLGRRLRPVTSQPARRAELTDELPSPSVLLEGRHRVPEGRLGPASWMQGYSMVQGGVKPPVRSCKRLWHNVLRRHPIRIMKPLSGPFGHPGAVPGDPRL